MTRHSRPASIAPVITGPHRQQLHTHRARVRLLRAAADYLHEDISVGLTPSETARDLCHDLRAVGVEVMPTDLLDYHNARRIIADVDDRTYPGTPREAAVARLDAEEQVVWHEDNVGGERDA